MLKKSRSFTLILSLFLFSEISFAQSPFSDLIKKAGDSEGNGGANLVVVFDSTDILVEESGLAHINIHSLVKILTTEGILDQSSRRFDYDPASNMVEIQKITVHSADGKVREIPLKDGAVLDLPQPQHMIYWGARMKLVGITDLEVGDAVEVQYYTKGFMIAYLDQTSDDSRYIPPMRGHFYDTILFGGGIPIKEKVYVLKTPLNKDVQYKVYNGNIAGSFIIKDSLRVYTFEKRDIPVYSGEPKSPDGQDYIPKVVLATVNDWFEKSKWFYQVNEESVIDIYGMKVKPFEWESDPELIAKVKEITAPYKTDKEKRWALLHWVAQHIRYSGISMGKGEGYTLHPGIMTFRDRCGVCKDIAGMAITMFRAAGYTTNPTMTMAGARVEKIPADQFNHCVVAVDISQETGLTSDNLPGTKWEMYDPTWAPNQMDVWSRAEGEQHIVIGSPEGEDLQAIRAFTSDENRYHIISNATIDRNGDLVGSFGIKANGYSDGRLRRIIVYSGGYNDLKNRLAGFISGIAPGAELMGFTHDDEQDFSQPMTLKIDYKVPGFALHFKDGLHFVSPAGKLIQSASYLFNALTGLDKDKRETPLMIWSPQKAVVDEIVIVPKGLKLGEFEPMDKGGEVASFKAEVRESKNKAIEISFNYAFNKRTILPEEYPQAKETADGFKNFVDTNIYLWR